MKITPFFRWYDIWVGAFIDTKKRTVYICPFPMIGVKVELPPPPPKEYGSFEEWYGDKAKPPAN